MRFILFFLFVLAVYSEAPEDPKIAAFRYNKGEIQISNGDKKEMNGTLYYQKIEKTHYLMYVGMDPTKTAFIVYGTFTEGDKKVANPMNMTYNCFAGAIKRNPNKNLTGNFKLEGNWNETKITGNCIVKEDAKETWNFTSNAKRSKTLLYEPKEAGKRARNLLNEKKDNIDETHVILYSILDYPYFANDCNFYFRPGFVDLYYPEEGAIIVGKDGKECGIIDDKTIKFIHGIDGTITETLLAGMGKYFKNGVMYKKFIDPTAALFLIK